MCIGNTLRDISKERSLNKAEKVPLRKIAKEYEKLQAENKRQKKEILRLMQEIIDATPGEYRKQANIEFLERRKKEWGMR